MTLLSEPRPFTNKITSRQLNKAELAALLREAAANTAALPVEPSKPPTKKRAARHPSFRSAE